VDSKVPQGPISAIGVKTDYLDRETMNIEIVRRHPAQSAQAINLGIRGASQSARHRRRLVLETLESRQLLSVSIADIHHSRTEHQNATP
jgi:hypothetical protein